MTQISIKNSQTVNRAGKEMLWTDERISVETAMNKKIKICPLTSASEISLIPILRVKIRVKRIYVVAGRIIKAIFTLFPQDGQKN
jgi:hypothetical protein